MTLRNNRNTYNKDRDIPPEQSAAKVIKNTSSDHPHHRSFIRAGRNIMTDSKDPDSKAVWWDQEGCIRLREGDVYQSLEFFSDALNNFSKDNYLGIARATAHSSLAYATPGYHNNPELAKKLITEALDYHDRDIDACGDNGLSHLKGERHRYITEASYQPRVMISIDEDPDGIYLQRLLEFCQSHDPAITVLEYIDAINFALKCDLSPAQQVPLSLRKVDLELANDYDNKERLLSSTAALKLANTAVSSSLHAAKWVSLKALRPVTSVARHAQQAIDNRQ